MTQVIDEGDVPDLPRGWTKVDTGLETRESAARRRSGEPPATPEQQRIDSLSIGVSSLTNAIEQAEWASRWFTSYGISLPMLDEAVAKMQRALREVTE